MAAHSHLFTNTPTNALPSSDRELKRVKSDKDGDDGASPAQRPHDPELVLGVDTGVDGHLSDRPIDLLVAHPFDLRAADGPFGPLMVRRGRLTTA